jgi:hypothetical protein
LFVACSLMVVDLYSWPGCWWHSCHKTFPFIMQIVKSLVWTINIYTCIVSCLLCGLSLDICTVFYNLPWCHCNMCWHARQVVKDNQLLQHL